MDTYQEALAKDKAAYEAEQERKRAKVERQKEREAIRQRRAEQEALERQAAANSSLQGVTGTRVNQTPTPTTTIQANSPEELQALTSKFGASVQISPEQVAVLAKQGGGTISTGPIMMTPEQAADFQAKHNAGGSGPVVMVGKPIMVNRSPSSPTKLKSTNTFVKTSPKKDTTTISAVRKPATTNKVSSPSFKASKTALKLPAATQPKPSTKAPTRAGGGGVAALRSKFGG